MTRPCSSLNWYDPGVSGIVPAGGRFTTLARLRLPTPAHAALTCAPPPPAAVPPDDVRCVGHTRDVSFRSEQLVGQPGYLDDGNPRITAETLEFSHRSGIAIPTWVIDDKATMNTLIDLGIDGTYTRRPDVLVEVLAERGLIAGD